MGNLILKERLVIQKAIVNELYIPKKYREKSKLVPVSNIMPILSLINSDTNKIEDDK